MTAPMSDATLADLREDLRDIRGLRYIEAEEGRSLLARLDAAVGEVDRLREELAATQDERDQARELVVDWRASVCSPSEIADPANGFALPWEKVPS